MWTLLWVLLTPGGDVISHGVEQYQLRHECNANRRHIESQHLILGQKIQAICLQIK